MLSIYEVFSEDGVSVGYAIGKDLKSAIIMYTIKELVLKWPNTDLINVLYNEYKICGFDAMEIKDNILQFDGKCYEFKFLQEAVAGQEYI